MLRAGGKGSVLSRGRIAIVATDTAGPSVSSSTAVRGHRYKRGMPDDGDTHQVTHLLGEIAEGKSSARNELIDAVYDQLRKIAQVRMNAERSDHTLQATALVHEAYLKLAPGLGEREIKNRFDFYGAAAEAMRRILIDHARAQVTGKRRGEKVSLNEIGDVACLANTNDSDLVVAVSEALESLANKHPDLATLVRLRFYAGLSIEETAKVLESSRATVNRRWSVARMLLFEAVQDRLANQCVS